MDLKPDPTVVLKREPPNALERLLQACADYAAAELDRAGVRVDSLELTIKPAGCLPVHWVKIFNPQGGPRV